MPRKGGDRTRTVRSIRRQRFSSTRKSRSIRPYPHKAKKIKSVKSNAPRLQGMDENNASLETGSQRRARLKLTEKSNNELVRLLKNL